MLLMEHLLVFTMSDWVALLSHILPIIATTLLSVLLLANFYAKIRRKFPVSVNCWFCNTWTKVAFDDCNSFECTNCHQYNGFTKEGDYNKVIPEQHDELMNHHQNTLTDRNVPTNGLCIFCNNNQKLKAFQLANFIPMQEENYDLEIEHFQEQLEKAYKLCKKCDKVLKKTLDKQNAWIFGNRLKSMCQKGPPTVNLVKPELKRTLLVGLSRFVSVLAALIIFSIVISNFTFLYTKNSYIASFRNWANSVYYLDLNQFNSHLPKRVKISFIVGTCISASLIEGFSTLWEQYSTMKLNRLLCWTILVLSSWIRVNKPYALYISPLQIFTCCYLIYSAFIKAPISQSPTRKQCKSMRKFVKNLEKTCSDYSDLSEFDDRSISSIHQSVSECMNKSIKTKSVVSHFEPQFNEELNLSLGNLRLGAPTSPVFSVVSVPRPKPVLSPSKFTNNWVAGGFWRNEDLPVIQKSFSRASSESSGFGSQHNEGFIPEFDRRSDFTHNRRVNYLFAPHLRQNPWSTQSLQEFGAQPYQASSLKHWPEPEHSFQGLNLGGFSNRFN